ncbi:hypothetical protein, partial [Microbispora sp. ATCC PTA-5024]|uniref:hypothetical protein n=1 Tax=Microbispora sp. ATCC PTA-5024 TaxID=316330 RepID=UPI001E46D1D5
SLRTTITQRLRANQHLAPPHNHHPGAPHNEHGVATGTRTTRPFVSAADATQHNADQQTTGHRFLNG